MVFSVNIIKGISFCGRRSVILDDYLLIRLIKNGDKQALDSLVRKHYDNIFRYCYRRCYDNSIAADLTQDVFLKVIETIYKYRFTGKFSNYLFTIAVNRCNDYYRSKTVFVDYQNLGLIDPSDQAVDIYKKQEEKQELERQLNLLPDKQKEALILYYFHDLKAKDIAKITEVPLATVKSRIKQGLEKLRKVYKNDKQ